MHASSPRLAGEAPDAADVADVDGAPNVEYGPASDLVALSWLDTDAWALASARRSDESARRDLERGILAILLASMRGAESRARDEADRLASAASRLARVGSGSGFR